MPRKRHEFHLNFGQVGRIGDVVRFQIAENLSFEIGQLSDKVGNKKDIGYANRSIEHYMKRAVLDAYDQNVAAHKKNDYARRGRKNRYTGQLRNALAKHVVTAKGQEIRFVNITKLDEEARHWKRLNFGVQGTELNPPRSPSIPVRFEFFGTTGTTNIGFNEGPRAPFTMPFGFFREANTTSPIDFDASRRGQDWFMPLSKFTNNRNGLRTRAGRAVGMPTRGIKERRFLEAGIEAYAEHAPGIYRELVAKWFRTDGTPPTVRRL